MENTATIANGGRSQYAPMHFQLGSNLDSSSNDAGLFEQLLNLQVVPAERPEAGNDSSQSWPGESQVDEVVGHASDVQPAESEEVVQPSDDEDEIASSLQDQVLLIVPPATHSPTAVEDPEQTTGTALETKQGLAVDAPEVKDAAGAEMDLSSAKSPSTQDTDARQLAPSTDESIPKLENVGVEAADPKTPDQTLAAQGKNEAELSAKEQSALVDAQPAVTTAEESPESDPLDASGTEALGEELEPIKSQPNQERSPRERSNSREKWYEQRRNSAADENSAASAEQRARVSSVADARENTAGLPVQHQSSVVQHNPDQATSQTPVVQVTTAAPNIPLVSSATGAFIASQTEVLSLDATAAPSSPTTEVDGREPHSSSSTSSERTRAQTTASKETSPVEQTDLSQEERVRLIQRISRSFSRLGPNGGSINLKLHPPQLGALNVQVRLEGRSMSAKLSTETAAARDAILEGLPALRTRLAEQGFDISQFQVEVAQGRGDTTTTGGHSHQERGFEQSDQSRQERTVDYRRRWNAETSQQVRELGRSTPTELSWQVTTGIDIQA
jgi:flagellar hook-length control protein FliK